LETAPQSSCTPPTFQNGAAFHSARDKPNNFQQTGSHGVNTQSFISLFIFLKSYQHIPWFY
jgi:hypothetical protein